MPAPVRTRDAERTRADILLAAQRLFSRQGYLKTGVRDIAQAAGIDPALVLRYFGSKEQLFELALVAAVTRERAHVAGADRSDYGRTVLAYMGQRPADSISPITMMIMATADDAARAISIRVLQEQVLGPLAAWLGGAEAPARAALVAALSSGFVMYHTLLPLPPLGGPAGSPAHQWLADTLQLLVDAQPGPASGMPAEQRRDAPLSSP